MTSLRQSLLILTIAILTMCRCIQSNTQKKSLVDKVGEFVTSPKSEVLGASVNSFGKTMASHVVEYYLSQGKSGLSIAILNSMQSRYLVNPILFLARGKTVGPPLLMIPPAAEDESTAKLIYLEGKPKGILCYNLTATQQVASKLICLYFEISKEVGNLFSFDISNDVSILQERSVLSVLKSLTSEKVIGRNLVYEPYGLQIVAITQMTTGDNAELFLEVKDSPKVQSIVFKRQLVSALAMGLAGGVVSALTNAAKKYFTKKYGTILTLENLSNDEAPFVLYDPIWYQDADLQIHNIIPWKLEQGQSRDITLTAGMTLKTTVVFALSFKVEEMEYTKRLVLALWYPSFKDNSKRKYGWYSISWLGPIKNTDVPDLLRLLVKVIKANPFNAAAANREANQYQILEPFGDHTTTATTLPRLNYVPIESYQCYKFWSIPVQRSKEKFKDLKLLTAMGNGEKNGMVLKMFGGSRVPNPGEYSRPSFIPAPVDYSYSEEQNPPM